jgi:two-component system, response regulator YesN
MYKVLIADDERIIREGISQLVKWEDYDLNVVDVAVNGLDAFEKIIKHSPDIVITDIKMPGMSGLELIERIKLSNNYTKFIILSGYGEFNLAKKAMNFGVKHYILKPTSEEEIIKVLRMVIDELSVENQKKSFLEEIKRDLEVMIPLAKEQFIRDRALNKIYSNDELAFYKKMFNIDNYELQVILIEFEDEFNMEEMLALERIVKNNFLKEEYSLASFIKNSFLILKKITDQNILLETINKIKETFFSYYNKNITVAIGSKGNFDKLHILYQEAKQLLKYKFYLGEGSIITNDDIKESNNLRILNNYYFKIEQIVITVKCGDIEAVRKEIGAFIEELKNEKLEKEIITSYSLELLLSIIRNNFDNIKDDSNKEINEYFTRILNIQKLKTISEIEKEITDIALEITDSNYKIFTHKKNRLVQLLIQKVEENIDNENLSLKWLAKNMVFANVDYLSKLFKKEMTLNFSQYVIQQRMERAKKLLKNTGDDRIYEVAYKVGFGYNSQYFSQVFKSYTGLSPSEYRAKLEEDKIIDT